MRQINAHRFQNFKSKEKLFLIPINYQGITTYGTEDVHTECNTRNGPDFGRVFGVPYVKLYRKTPKHLYPKLNGFGDNGQ